MLWKGFPALTHGEGAGEPMANPGLASAAAAPIEGGNGIIAIFKNILDMLGILPYLQTRVNYFRQA